MAAETYPIRAMCERSYYRTVVKDCKDAMWEHFTVHLCHLGMVLSVWTSLLILPSRFTTLTTHSSLARCALRWLGSVPSLKCVARVSLDR